MPMRSLVNPYRFRAFRHWLPCLLIPALLPALGGCGIFKTSRSAEKEDVKPSVPPRLVGRIASIPPGKKFVLIQSYDTWNIEPGTILTTRGPDSRSANLRVTGESNSRFAAADLQSGTVEVGDAVYSRHVPKPPETPSEPQALPEPVENQESQDSENVQKNS